ncbi:MAG: DNA polymerase subunit beta [Cyanobacteria bacterium J069]|nr:MAG: DNA polymerase subunit beta [Cyanobacteria bacterium J069]
MQIPLPQPAIADFCEKWQVQELSFFGSVLREDFHTDSDVDVLVSFRESAAWGLLEFVRMKRELEQLLGREVDLLTKKSIEQSHNWIRRREILETAQVVYVAG